MIAKERFLTMEQVSNILGITKKTLYQWSWRRQNLPFVKIGGALRVSENDLIDFIQKNKKKLEDK